MARGKRARSEAEDPELHRDVQAGEERAQVQQQQQPGDRREQMADIARRRAAHFANFGDDDAEGDGNVHVGKNEARTLGPWSSAVELVNARQAAAEQRNKQLQQGQQEEGADVAWTPSRDPALGPRPSCQVPPLFQIALQLLVTHIDAVETLWGVPDPIRSQLASAVCGQRALSPDVAQLFGSDFTSELVLPDCVQLDPAAMLQLLQLLVVGRSAAAEAGKQQQQGELAQVSVQQDDQQQPQCCRLERLELGNCGRGFTDEAAAALAGAGPLQQLRVLRLGGAYKLNDAGLLALLQASPGLQELTVPSASRLTGSFLCRLPAAAPQLCVLELSDCRGLPGAAIASLLQQLGSLARVKLDGIPEVDAAVLSSAGRCTRLRALSLARCPHVDDAALTAFAALSRPGQQQQQAAHSPLEELVLDECAAVSDAGLLAVVGAARQLRVLSLRRCGRLTDASLLPAVQRGTLEVLSVNGLHQLSSHTLTELTRSCREVLRELDVSFCRGIAEGALGQLVDACEQLSVLKVYGCSQLTARFLHGHSSTALTQVLGVGTCVAAR
ncbi:hypothetical protein COO60DRAFT_17560 [Scenedesmus sp. NREL 46B-D3]|nr:hypothetical protein COO60DRAFT_17560 [Scenedesmus sp. NREL 46B-D3]